jgi:hypothetical protein
MGSRAMTNEADGVEIKVEQRSTIGAMLWSGTYTTILSILTLTLFRFWGRTQFRRRLWKEALIDNEPLEYVGKGSELFSVSSSRCSR